MPHIICEYSANLEKKIKIDALLETLHSAMMRTGAAELGGLRTRADRRDHYRIADNDSANGFVEVTHPGRKGRCRKPQAMAETVFAAARSISKACTPRRRSRSRSRCRNRPRIRLHTSNIRTWMKASCGLSRLLGNKSSVDPCTSFCKRTARTPLSLLRDRTV